LCLICFTGIIGKPILFIAWLIIWINVNKQNEKCGIEYKSIMISNIFIILVIQIAISVFITRVFTYNDKSSFGKVVNVQMKILKVKKNEKKYLNFIYGTLYAIFMINFTPRFKLFGYVDKEC